MGARRHRHRVRDPRAGRAADATSRRSSTRRSPSRGLEGFEAYAPRPPRFRSPTRSLRASLRHPGLRPPFARSTVTVLEVFSLIRLDAMSPRREPWARLVGLPATVVPQPQAPPHVVDPDSQSSSLWSAQPAFRPDLAPIRGRWPHDRSAWYQAHLRSSAPLVRRRPAGIACSRLCRTPPNRSPSRQPLIAGHRCADYSSNTLPPSTSAWGRVRS